MTLDEAIRHCEEVAKENERIAFDLTTAFNMETIKSKECKKCANEHRQLAEWLKDYKRLKEQELNEDWHDTPSGEMTLEQARQAVRELRKYVMDKSKDMINRQTVKEQMIKYGFYAPDITVTEFVEDLPPVNPQEPKVGWIPVSERLPEPYQSILVTAEDFHFANEPVIYSVYKKSFSGDVDFIAWMPLPEPYEPRESEEV